MPQPLIQSRDDEQTKSSREIYFPWEKIPRDTLWCPHHTEYGAPSSHRAWCTLIPQSMVHPHHTEYGAPIQAMHCKNCLFIAEYSDRWWNN